MRLSKEDRMRLCLALGNLLSRFPPTLQIDSHTFEAFLAINLKKKDECTIQRYTRNGAPVRYLTKRFSELESAITKTVQDCIAAANGLKAIEIRKAWKEKEVELLAELRKLRLEVLELEIQAIQSLSADIK